MKPEVEPLTSSQQEGKNIFSIHKEDQIQTGTNTQNDIAEDKVQDEIGVDQEVNQQDGKAYQRDGRGNQKEGQRVETRWNTKKKRGPNRKTITLGGLKRIEDAKKRKEKQRLRRKLGEMGVQDGRKQRKPQGQIPPTRSVLFVDNTAGGEMARRFQLAEEEAGNLSGYRIRIT